MNNIFNKKFEYTLKDNIYKPNKEVIKEKPIVLNRYGRMRIEFLKKHKKALYEKMLLEGTLSAHLESIQEEAANQIGLLIDQLKATSELTENMKNTDQLRWIKIMNAIKNQAEEIVIRELILI